jgi:hypothetical protein
MAEWSKAPVLKTGEGLRSPWVRIPLPPQIETQVGFCQFNRTPQTPQWRILATLNV